MRSRRRRLILLFAVLALARPVWAQSPPQESSPAEEPAGQEAEYTLSFGRAGGTPGNEVALSLFFTRRPGAPNVGKLRVRLTYPHSALQYKRFEDAYLARRAGLRTEARQERASGDLGVLDLTFTLPEPAEKNFPSGQLAFVHFQISSVAEQGTVAIKAELWINEQPATPANHLARVEDGHVLVATTPLFVGCFFFTH